MPLQPSTTLSRSIIQLYQLRATFLIMETRASALSLVCGSRSLARAQKKHRRTARRAVCRAAGRSCDASRTVASRVAPACSFVRLSCSLERRHGHGGMASCRLAHAATNFINNQRSGAGLYTSGRRARRFWQWSSSLRQSLFAEKCAQWSLNLSYRPTNLSYRPINLSYRVDVLRSSTVDTSHIGWPCEADGRKLELGASRDGKVAPAQP